MYKKENRKARAKFKTIEERVGKVSMTREGYAFIVSQGFKDDVFVTSRKLRGALNNDIVKITVKVGNGKRTEGEVVEILSRSTLPYTGILQINRNNAWVIVENKNMPYDIAIDAANIDISNNGKKVVAIVDDWHFGKDSPSGHILDVLGVPGENNTEMHAILAEFGLPYRFEKEVEEQAEKIHEEITPSEIAKRRDFRTIPTLTIDPYDAKDFDDALSLNIKPNGNFEIGIHIADVTHYVDKDSLIEAEAIKRATSVYLVDRTIPMLPEKLSNRLCSLRPNEEKLCFTALFEITEKGKIIDKWFGKSIIKSDYRFSYEEAQLILEGGNGPLKKELHILHSVAGILREERFRLGAISFERPEMKVEVDENGKPINIYIKESKDSNWLIEEFMLLANKEVARFVNSGGRERSFIYRIHDQPDIEKITILKQFVKTLGYKFNLEKGGKVSSAINDLLKRAKGKPEESAIEMMSLRSMARAKYSTDNIGHYGLAFDYYTHFTSPIRRYPDMMVHRLLEHYLSKGKSPNKEIYEDLCKHSSEREQLASDAERASIKYKMVEFMQEHIGEIYAGRVSGVTEWGIYVEIDKTGVEGMVALREIREDYFVYDEKSNSLYGRKSGKKFTFGTPVKIKVTKANLEQRQLDFALIWE